MSFLDYTKLQGNVLFIEDEPDDLERLVSLIGTLLPDVKLELSRTADGPKEALSQHTESNDMEWSSSDVTLEDEFEEDSLRSVGRHSDLNSLNRMAYDNSATLNEEWNRFDQCITELLKEVDVVVLDLKLGEFRGQKNYPEIYKQTGQFSGLAILDSVTGGVLFRNGGEKAQKHPTRFLINSAQFSSLRTDKKLGNAVDKVAKLTEEGVFGTFHKLPEKPEMLLSRIYSILDLQARGYHCDFRTQNELLVIAQRQLSKRQESVLILGKSGTGKEEAAWHIHQVGHFMRKVNTTSIEAQNIPALQVVHCGSLTQDLARDELFGHVQGAFTGATGHKLGKIIWALGPRLGASVAEKNKASAKYDAERAQIITAVSDFRAKLATHANLLQNGREKKIGPIELYESFKNVVDAGIKLFPLNLGSIQDYLTALTSMDLTSVVSSYRTWLTCTGLFEQLDCLNLRVKADAPIGTLFLDEFAALDTSVQALLLRFTQELEIQPLGYEGKISFIDKDRRSHLRLIGATNEPKVYRALGLDPETGSRFNRPELERKFNNMSGDAARDFLGALTDSFRPDLCYRMAEWIVHVPDLISNELEAMIDLERQAMKSNDLCEAPDFATDAKEKLRKWIAEGQFAGQRRELRGVLRRALVMTVVPQPMGMRVGQKTGKVTLDILESVFNPVVMNTNTTETEAERFLREKLTDIVGDKLAKSRCWSSLRKRAGSANNLEALAELVADLLVRKDVATVKECANMLGTSPQNLDCFGHLRSEMIKRLKKQGRSIQDDEKLTAAQFKTYSKEWSI